ncbi:MAG: hypothetical protein JW918_10180 [Anaerolineae bacterium]|nr:hypothetical protein [Anaerolineae bacterium]
MVRRALIWLNARRLVVAILFVALFAMAVRAPVDTDTWWHLKAGQVTLERGQIIRSDPFSHTFYGSPWVAYSWLSEVILYWLFRTFSYAGLGVMIGVMVAAAFAFVTLQMEGDPFSRAFIIILAAATSAVVWIARPHLFSFLLTSVLAYILYLFKWRGVNRLWLLPPLFVLWVNLHAGYALGFMVLAAFVAGEVLNRLLALIAPTDDPVLGWRKIGLVVGLAVLSFLLLAIHPNTVRMWTYYVDTVRVGFLQDFIQEWQSPDFHPLYVQPFIWLLLGTLAAVGLSGRRVDGVDLALVGMFAYASFVARRNFGPFALVAAPVLSRHVAAALKRFGLSGWLSRKLARGRPIAGAINGALLALVIGLAVVKVWTPLNLDFNVQEQRKSLPVDAAAWILENRPEGEMFNPYNWGGYLMWALWPEYRVFVDGRTDMYGDAFLREHMRVQLGQPGFEDTLLAYDVNLIVTYPDDALSARLECAGGWAEVYRDGVAVIWVREGR